MSTFDGRIKEYPAISIDRFKLNGYAKYYLLSHVHSGIFVHVNVHVAQHFS
jgi:hypothetical protein